MALQNWAFIYTAPGSPSEGTVSIVETPACRTVLVGVPDVESGVRIAPRLVAEGAQLIELCGGFGPMGTARVLSVIQHAVPVGSVAYGPESVDGVHAIFAPGA
ncbi:DUF6506 family protein [Pendulispora albinea]|uniref:DUF6506 family protein n=1 Tax=Pendulispora albinea TaxID=2741071 RepID=A0ABZ2M7E8_9BACT